ncbi:MAG: FAD-dependent oxidoreductase [Candidatus Bathyarchaeota archaeon]|nr:MAG: FAD-dependent oxidoreductase [Candidatus Bathyarchaeota archaeon]
MIKHDPNSMRKRKLPPCRAACPADVNVQAYIALIQQGKFNEAVEVIRRSMPFPAICGRVCFSPCQDACTRKEIDKPVGVRYLKRLAADIEREQRNKKPEPISVSHDKKVAIIGAGPAGLSAAYDLAKRGYPVVVFECMPEAGGMMRYGIPDYRLQKYVVAKEIMHIQDLGVEIKTNVEFGKDVNFETLRSEGYKAFFVAIGAQISRKLGVPGEELKGVFYAVEWLRDIALGKTVDLGEKVIVIGGGNSAIDAARISLKLGAKKVIVAYRRSRMEMPALPQEVEAAKKEGVKLNFLISPKRIIGEGGKVKAIEFLRMKLGKPDASGRRRPVPIQRSEHLYEANTVIPAIGQIVKTAGLPSLLLDKRGLAITANLSTLETRMPGVFSGGDSLTGPASVIEAVKAGKRAAESIDRYFSDRAIDRYIDDGDVSNGGKVEVEETTWVKHVDTIIKKPERYIGSHVDIGRWEASFEEADELLARNKETAISEARRCLECGPCTECLGNEKLCDADKAIINEKLCSGCNLCAVICPYAAVKKNDAEIAQVDEDLCKGCGICSASCPDRAITMKKLPDAQIVAEVETALRRAAI